LKKQASRRILTRGSRYDYDQVGRLRNSFTGASARAYLNLPGSSWVGDGQTPRSGGHTGEQPRQYTSYERDANGEDEAMHRRYNRWWSRFSQPDPSYGSMNLADPQSLNRYSDVQNDPVNFVDSTGLCPGIPPQISETYSTILI
jgi:RHS repeat-associated protein